ncbi:MAG: glycoside hydrolase family 32 protein [Microbacterium sp.]
METGFVTEEGAVAGGLRDKALEDALRPRYHFVSPAGWLNDPNGVAQRDGVYHLFYQYNPYGAEHHRIHWGHAVSGDLVHWTDRPIALRPAEEGPDSAGCWSGVLVDDDGRPVIVYSAHRDEWESACLAYGDDTLDVWRKEERNPVIAGPPEGAAVTAFRDHCVWREAGVWRQIVGSGLRGVGGCAFLYESDDLATWHELGPLVVGDARSRGDDDPDWTGTSWECVDFFRFSPGGATAPPDAASGDVHLLVFSAWDEGRTMHAIVAQGRYQRDRFEVERYQRLDLGGRYAYAPQSFVDESGRRVVWAWMQEGRSKTAQRGAGWSGAMTLPRRLWLDADGIVREEPVPELESLRAQEVEWSRHEAEQHTTGTQTELSLEASIPPDAVLRVVVMATPDEREETVIELSAATDGALTLSVDRSRSSLDESCDSTPRRGPVPHMGGPVPVRVFLDRSSVEIFAAGIALTTRVYPTRADAAGIRVEAHGGAVVSNLVGWALAGAEQADRALDPQIR